MELFLMIFTGTISALLLSNKDTILNKLFMTRISRDSFNGQSELELLLRNLEDLNREMVSQLDFIRSNQCNLTLYNKIMNLHTNQDIPLLKNLEKLLISIGSDKELSNSDSSLQYIGKIYINIQIAYKLYGEMNDCKILHDPYLEKKKYISNFINEIKLNISSLGSRSQITSISVAEGQLGYYSYTRNLVSINGFSYLLILFSPLIFFTTLILFRKKDEYKNKYYNYLQEALTNYCDHYCIGGNPPEYTID